MNLTDIERKFVAIYSEGLKGLITVRAKKGNKADTLPGKERKLIVHHMNVMDTAATRKIVHGGVPPFFGPVERSFLKT